MNGPDQFKVRVTASFGAIVPDLANLGRSEPEGSREMSEWWESLAMNHQLPDGWFMAEHGELSPTLFLAGAVYTIDAFSPERACGCAEERFRTQLTALKPPIVPESIFAVLEDDD